MASRLFNRSKTVALPRLLSHPIPPPFAASPPARSYASLAPPAAGSTSLFGHGKTVCHDKLLLQFISRSACSGTYGSMRHFSVKPKVGETELEANTPKKNDDSSKILAFSPLEGSLAVRQSGLAFESLKVRLMERSNQFTYVLIPGLILISKSTLSTSLLILSVYWQIYGFFREIFLDYVHHEVTLKWVLIYFKLLLLILAKDTIVNFNLL